MAHPKSAWRDDASGSWHYRRADLTAYAGKTISHISLISESTTDAGAWQLRFTDIALLSTDGDIRPVYNRQKTVSLAMSGSSGVTGRAYQVSHLMNTSHDVSTNYFHGDQLGSSRMVLSANGHPTWQATYLPYGEEYSPQIGMNTYKFTGYDNDSGSGLDYAKFRHYDDRRCRFTSPDPLMGNIQDPQSLNRYAYTVGNPINLTDPLGLIVYVDPSAAAKIWSMTNFALLYHKQLVRDYDAYAGHILPAYLHSAKRLMLIASTSPLEAREELVIQTGLCRGIRLLCRSSRRHCL